MILVVDASVALKWFFRLRRDEADVQRALAVLGDVDSGHHRMVQPPHFLAEMAAVLARKKPADARRDLRDLQDMAWDTVDEPAVYAKAIELSVRFGHHLFDTLYHATALLMPGSFLITADLGYYRKSGKAGQIALLANYESNDSSSRVES